MNYFDLHCDTPFELYKHLSKLDSNDHYISLDKASVFDRYAQFSAYCSVRKLDDETCFRDYLKCVDYFEREVERLSDRVMICDDYDDLLIAESLGRVAVFQTVEAARITAGEINRLNVLFDHHCRFITPVWGDTSCIGGAHNTEVGLTEFGKQLIKRCFEIGITPDISHSSERTVDDIVLLSDEYKKPFIASHSNSFAVYSHSRNLRDRHFLKIVEVKGLVGISLCDIHLKDTTNSAATLDDVIKHIEHYMELGGQDVLAFGFDLDGCDPPKEIRSVADVPMIMNRLLQLNYSEELVEKISYDNARQYIKRSLRK